MPFFFLNNQELVLYFEIIFPETFTTFLLPGKQFTATDARFVYKRLISDALMAIIAKAKIV
jgi:hypothetical protein